MIFSALGRAACGHKSRSGVNTLRSGINGADEIGVNGGTIKKLSEDVAQNT